MSARWLEIIRVAWEELVRHPARARQFRTRRISEDLPLDAYAAIRAIDDAPCLLIQAEVPADVLFEVGGMRLHTYISDDGPLLVLTLENPLRSDLFATVCADAIAACDGALREEALPRFLSRLGAWRSFLRERRAGLTGAEITGLLGELIVLQQLLERSTSLLSTWVAPENGLHDFASSGHALEIKSTLGPGATVRISSLDQLDLTGLRKLDLIHVRLVESPQGRNLDQICREIDELLVTEGHRRTFANALLRRGLMPDDIVARSTPLVLTRLISAYSVSSEFPKLIRATVPTGIREAEYVLELRNLTPYSADYDLQIEAFAGSAGHE